jgi:hypothetical protein
MIKLKVKVKLKHKDNRVSLLIVMYCFFIDNFNKAYIKNNVDIKVKKIFIDNMIEIYSFALRPEDHCPSGTY